MHPALFRVYSDIDDESDVLIAAFASAYRRPAEVPVTRATALAHTEWSVERDVLDYARRHPGPFRLTDVCTACGLSARQVRDACDRLAESGRLEYLGGGGRTPLRWQLAV